MGFLDKVKETAAKAGEGVKKGTSSVRDKMEDSQLRKKADENAKAIGYLVVKDRTEGASNGPEIDRLAQEITARKTDGPGANRPGDHPTGTITCPSTMPAGRCP